MTHTHAHTRADSHADPHADPEAGLPGSRTDGRRTPGVRVATSTIWHEVPDLALANSMSADCTIGHLGIEFTGVGADELTARMPVDRRTRQPFGLLHGGASVLLAETLVSFGATLVAGAGRACVGMEINANHLRPVTSGWVTGTTRPVSLGRRTQVWETHISDEDGRLVCVSRCTVAVLEAEPRSVHRG